MGRNQGKQAAEQAAEQAAATGQLAANQTFTVNEPTPDQPIGKDSIVKTICAVLAVTEAVEQEQADAKAAEAAEQAAEQQRKETALLTALVDVMRAKDQTEAYTQGQYAAVYSVLHDKLQDVAEISDFLIATDKHWPLNKKGDKTLGIGAACKEHYPNAMALSAYNVWRSNYCRGWAILTKPLVKLFKQAEKLIEDKIYQSSKHLLKMAIANADAEQDFEAATEILETAIQAAQTEAEAEAREAAEAEAATAEAEDERIKAAIQNLENASLSRVLKAVLQLAANPVLAEAEAGLILAAGHKLAERVQAEKQAAEQAAAEVEKQAAATEQAAAEQEQAALEHLAATEQEQVKDGGNDAPCGYSAK